jgi:tRNA (mo5U34)-methyltransferase
MQELKRRLSELGWYHSIDVPGVGTIPGLQSSEQLRKRLAKFPIPDDLRGKRVLDIGAWDGWFSFEMERRGAAVVAMDNAEHHRFREAKKLLGSSVEYVSADICRVTPRDIGHFDFVLFFGVLYHLKHPLLALENVCELATEAAFVESYVCDSTGYSTGGAAQKPYMEFYEGEELAGQFDNWVGPNVPCLLAMCRTAGFARVDFEGLLLDRAHVSCYRHWRSRPAGVSEDLIIVSAGNANGRGPEFHGSKDEYVNVWFKSGRGDLTADTVFPEIGGFGSRPVHLSGTGDGGYLLNCKLPPGLPAGSYEVTLADGAGKSANCAVIRIGEGGSLPELPLDQQLGEIRVRTVTDGVSWKPGEVTVGSRGGVLSLWAECFPPNLTASQVKLRAAGRILAASFVSARMPDGTTQINVPVPGDLTRGPANVELLLSGYPDMERSVAAFHVLFY